MNIESDKKALLIGDIVVLEEYRRQGIATQLIIYSLKKAKEKGFKKVFFAVTAKNPAKSFYGKLGFQELMTVTSIFVKKA